MSWLGVDPLSPRESDLLVFFAKLLRSTYWKIYTNCSAPVWFLFKCRSDILVYAIYLQKK